MPLEPLHWDRKEFVRERKHERSESVGSAGRWRDSSHHRDFNNRWGSAEFRRQPGYGKQGGWHQFSEESGHGYAVSRSSDRMFEEVNRSSVSRGEGKYGRIGREMRGPFGQRDWRGQSWEDTNSSVNLSRRPPNVNNNQRSVDDAVACSYPPHSDSINSWNQHHLKDQNDKMCGVNGLGTGPRCDRENCLGSWKPLKWTRPGSLSSRGSGFSHSSSLRSMGGADPNEVKAELLPRNAIANEPLSGEAVASMTPSVPSEDATSRKKPRLKWGEGLAKYEKKKVDGPDVDENKEEPVLSTCNMEPSAFNGPSVVDKSPKVTGFPGYASPATPSSVACSSSPGVDDKLFGKTTNVDNDDSNLTGSSVPGSQNHLPFKLEKLDINSLNNLCSSIFELIQSDDPSSVDSGLVGSTAMNKLLIWKADISKVLETTESEIDCLETELKSLRSESGDRCLCPAASGSLLVGNNEKSCEEPVGVSNKVTWPEPLKIASSDSPPIEEMPLSTNLHSVHENGQEEDIDSPGSATSKFVEPLPLVKAFSSCDAWADGSLCGGVNAVQSTFMKCLVPCTSRKDAGASACDDSNISMEVEDSMNATSGSGLRSCTNDILYCKIISSNKEMAKSACEVFAKLLPEGCCRIRDTARSDSCSRTFIMEKMAEKKRFARFKERVITLKFKALHHQWKEDMHLLSMRKCRLKSHRKHELSVRTTCIGNQKNRPSIHSRFPFSGNHLSLVPTSDIINFTSKLLSEPQVKVHRNTLKMPALILDKKMMMISKFMSCNGLVEDPLSVEKERAMINPWTPGEREIFLEKFAALGKDFRKIASFLDHKTTADCVEFYYKNHKSDCFEKLKKQDVCKLGSSFSAKTDLVASGKKWNYEINAASLEILNAASVMADGFAGNKKMRARNFLMGEFGNVKTSMGEDSIRDRSSNFDILGDDRQASVADVFTGICGSFSSEAMSSCVTSSVDRVEGNRDRKFLKVNPLCKQRGTPNAIQNVDDDTCSDESCGDMDPSDWTDEEKAAFLQAVSSSGKDFMKIARCVGTKSHEQCKVFFSKSRKCFGLDVRHPGPDNVGSPVNDDANDDGSDTDDACVVETGSAVGTDNSGTKTDEDLPSSALNTYHDESDPVEARNLSAKLNESKVIHGAEVRHEDVNLLSDACAIEGETKLSSDGGEIVLCSSDKSGSVSEQAAIIISNSTETGRGKANDCGGAVTELISALDTIEPCESNSAGEARVVSKVSSGALGNGLERCCVSSAPCSDVRDDKHKADTGAVVELKSSIQDSSTTINASLSSVGNSCSGLSFGAESKHVCGKSQISALYMEDLHATANSVAHNTASVDVQNEKNATQDRMSSTCDFQGNRNLHRHYPFSNGGHRLHIPGNSADHVGAVSFLQGYTLQVSNKKEVEGDIKCGSSATELPLLSQKIEQPDDHSKPRLWYSSDSEKKSRSGDVKLFGKILTNHSSAEKPNLTTNGSKENGIHHPRLSSKSSSLTFSGHHSTDENLKILKFDRNDGGDYLGLENVPLRSYGYWDGNRIQTGLSSVPDSAILLAKYPAAFSNYSTPSPKSDLQPFAKINERHLNGASAVTTRDINGSNGVVDYQMYRSRDGLKFQPFVVDAKHCQDVFSEMQRRNSFESISNLQQQAIGMVGMNSVRGPGIVVGGSYNGVSDPVAAIKMHYSSSDRYGSQMGNITRDDEPWARNGDFGR